MSNSMVVEMAPFELAEHITESQLLDASNKLQTGFLADCEGYISRTLVKTDNNKYMDIVHWSSIESANKASEIIFESTYCNAYFSCMKMEEGIEPKIMHYEVADIYT